MTHFSFNKKIKLYLAGVIFLLVVFLLVGSGLFLFNTANTPPPLFGLREKTEQEDFGSYLHSQLNICYEGESYGCYEVMADILLKKFEVSIILQGLARIEGPLGPLFLGCHTLTHYLGQHNYNTTASVLEVFESCDFTCAGGCNHGVVEGYFQDEDLYGLPAQTIIAEIVAMCTGDIDNSLYKKCLHGMGHGLMFFTNMDLPRSLELCDTFEGELAQKCYSGVFMENAWSTTRNVHPSKYLGDASNPLYPCIDLDERYLTKCYEAQARYFINLSSGDWEGAVDLCSQVPRPYHVACFYGLGTQQAYVQQRVGEMAKTCRLIREKESEDACIAGVLQGLEVSFHGDPAPMKEFCSLVWAESKSGCYTKIEEIIRI